MGMSEESGSERRKFPRLRTDSVISIAKVEPGRDELAHAIDVSMSGIRFQCIGVDLQIGDQLRVTLTLRGKTVGVVGQLVRLVDLDPFTQEVAIAFHETDPEGQRILDQILPEEWDEAEPVL
jgi:hypothetical protein